jgi:hypothetical protein
MHKINQELHAKIRELFPLQMGKAIVIEILSLEPLQYSAKTHETIDDLAEHTIGLMEEGKMYFVIDARPGGMPHFFYRDPYVSLYKDYFTDKVTRFRTRDLNKKIDLNKVKQELEQLASLLDPKAS